MEYEFVKFKKCAHIKLIFLNMQQLKIYFTNVFWFLIDGLQAAEQAAREFWAASTKV